MIKLKNITKSYDDTEILKNTNYTFPQKGLVCLLGPSGCGKSTLFNLIAGFDTDYKGSISVGESTLNLLNSDELCNYRKDHVGFIFQDYHLISGYTVLENILLPCDLSNNSKEENLNKANELLDKLGIESKKNEKIENLSGGQKQRVSIARALMKNPDILLADEPTGALDRNTSNEIMELLQSISKDILVVIITHDKKVSSLADEIIRIEDKEIIGIENNLNKKHDKVDKENYEITKSEECQINIKSRAKKNFKVHIKQFITVAIIIAFGISSFILSTSSQNVMKSSIEKFKEKNTAFNNGYIKYSNNKDKNILNLLLKDERISDAYYQYKLEDISLSLDNKEEKLLEYIPMAKTSESLSYGVMPRKNKNEIAITPSLAKKLNNDISKLIGKTITLKIGEYKKDLVISGIYNAGYDSIFISSDIEKDIYNKVKHNKDIFSISYDVKTFEDVIHINNMLIEKNINSINASKEVNNLISTFNNINRLFLIVSILIFMGGLFISIVLLSKLQNSRAKEIGLLSALGFSKNHIKGIVLTENMILSLISSIITLGLVVFIILISGVFDFPIKINSVQLISSVILTFLIVSIVSMIIGNKLVKTEPAGALRM